jgi:hypothetical protein
LCQISLILANQITLITYLPSKILWYHHVATYEYNHNKLYHVATYEYNHNKLYHHVATMNINIKDLLTEFFLLKL